MDREDCLIPDDASNTMIPELLQKHEVQSFMEEDWYLLMSRWVPILSHFHHLHTAASPSVTQELANNCESTISCSL
jgi:hypothetical protein